MFYKKNQFVHYEIIICIHFFYIGIIPMKLDYCALNVDNAAAVNGSHSRGAKN